MKLDKTLTDKDLAQIIAQMTLEDKAKFVSGRDVWSTQAFEKYDIPAMYVADGPHGLRKVRKTTSNQLGNTVPATCFPTASALGSTWNVELIEEISAAIGKECQANNIQILLGPGLNIKRTPLNGRNFEYYSEDPYLSGKIAAAFVRGVQSQGVAACIKHFTANNQEHERMMNSSNVDERTLREIYMRGFEIAIEEADPWTMMCAYNKVNGIWANEHEWLLTEVLRDEWNYKGIVMSDWAAVNNADRAVHAGLNLEMPANKFSPDKIVQAIKNGTLDEKRLDTVIKPLLRIALKTNDLKQENVELNLDAHHTLAIRAAEESIVLLKNENDILPLDSGALTSVAVLGRFAETPRYQGSGSSNVNAFKEENALENLRNILGNHVEINYLPFYESRGDKYAEADIQKAIDIAKKSDIALVFIGLPDDFEAEGLDRLHADLPESHKALIREVAAVQNNTIAILSNGAAVEIEEWERDVPAILESWLSGQGSGAAVANILFGKTNPSGKLSESFPLRLQHNPSHLYFPGSNRNVDYREGIFVGYRYYDTKSMEVMFPFGHGLSYTDFEYSDLVLNSKEFSDSDTLKVTCTIKNIGKRAGAEVVQLYVHDKASELPRPIKELQAFTKVYLESGASADIHLELNRRSFTYFDTALGEWFAESGDFDILVGSSSRDIRLRETVTLHSTQKRVRIFDKFSPLRDLQDHPIGRPFVEKMLQNFGTSLDSDEPEDHEAKAIFLSLPLIKSVNFSEGTFSEAMLEDFIRKINA